jgi:capsular polysaccharide transport system permease protein
VSDIQKEKSPQKSSEKAAEKPETENAVPAAPKGKVRKAPVSEGGKKSAFRPGATARSFLKLVIVPVLFVLAYNICATDRYAATSSFVVRSANSSTDSSMFESLAGSVSSGSTKSDSYIIRHFIESPDLVRQIDEKFGLEALYGPDRADPIQSLKPWMSFEDKVRYWGKRAFSTYDNTSGILTLEVQAYSAQEAKDLADFVMEQIENLVNELTLSARKSSYDFARKELEAAEQDLRDAHSRLTHFRILNNIIDPEVSSERDNLAIHDLNMEISERKVQLDELLQTVEVEGPNVTSLRRRIAALERQRDIMTKDIGPNGIDVTSNVEILSQYAEHEFEVEMATNRYQSLLEAEELARQEAKHEQRYLATFTTPYVAERAEYPRRLLNVFLAFVAATLVWAIGRFIIQMIKDHNQ